MLTKDAILAADDLPRELVQVPEWGGEVYVRALTGRELRPFEEAVTKETEAATKGTGAAGGLDMPPLKALLVALTVCDEAGEALFSVGDAPALGAKAGGVIARLFNVAMRLNGLHDDSVKELEGN